MGNLEKFRELITPEIYDKNEEIIKDLDKLSIENFRVELDLDGVYLGGEIDNTPKNCLIMDLLNKKHDNIIDTEPNFNCLLLTFSIQMVK
jgi:hypothetical protein